MTLAVCAHFSATDGCYQLALCVNLSFNYSAAAKPCSGGFSSRKICSQILFVSSACKSGLLRAVSITAKYLRRQGLTLSIEKCAVLAFTRKQMSRYPIMINGTATPAVTHHKFLGVIIDRDLSWSRHVAALKSKLKSFFPFFGLWQEQDGAHQNHHFFNCTMLYS